MRLGGTIEHQADSAAIEEAEPGRRLKEEAHSEDVPIKCDGPFHVFNRDRDLSYRAESKLGFRRLVHASNPLGYSPTTRSPRFCCVIRPDTSGPAKALEDFVQRSALVHEDTAQV